VKIVVDRGLCEAHGVCMSIEPEIFDLGDDDLLVLLEETPPEAKRAAIEEAVIRCPRQALTLQD
jgi:ferredoxin